MKQSVGIAAIRDADKALRKAGVRYWLDCGSLLGAVREGGIMDHDLDVDFSCWDPDKHQDVQTQMLLAGFEPYRTHGQPDHGYEQRFVHSSGIRVDVFYFYEGTVRDGEKVDDPELCWQGSWDKERLLVSEFPRGIVSDTIPYTFQGITVPVPVEFEAMLVARYGDWLTPVTKWDWRTDPKCLVRESPLQDVTFVIKNFMRPELTMRCVKSIRNFYGDVPVLVVDDSNATANFERDLRKMKVGLLRLPYDSGLSAGRNAGVKEVTTSRVVLLDDDMLITKDSNVAEMLTLLAFADVVCGSMIQGGRIVQWEGTYDLRGGGIRLIPLRHRRYGMKGGVSCAEVDFALNVLCSTKAFLLAHPWDEQLKLSEHTDWFLGLKKAKAKVLFAPESIVEHRPHRDKLYREFRRRKEFRLRFFHKHGFQFHVGYSGTRDIFTRQDREALEELLAEENA